MRHEMNTKDCSRITKRCLGCNLLYVLDLLSNVTHPTILSYCLYTFPDTFSTVMLLPTILLLHWNCSV